MVNNIQGNMHNDIDKTQKTYFTSEVSKMLGMAATTIRKYSQSLESNGYSFIKGKGTGTRQARLFTDKDVTVLRYLKEIREETNITVERATGIVIERFGKGTTQDTLSNNELKISDLERYSIQHDKLESTVKKQTELILKQNELILNLTERLEQQEKYIDTQIEERLNKQIKQVEAPKEKNNKPTQKKKSIFSKLFVR